MPALSAFFSKEKTKVRHAFLRSINHFQSGRRTFRTFRTQPSAPGQFAPDGNDRTRTRAQAEESLGVHTRVRKVRRVRPGPR